jgi:hypothetical protein
LVIRRRKSKKDGRIKWSKKKYKKRSTKHTYKTKDRVIIIVHAWQTLNKKKLEAHLILEPNLAGMFLGWSSTKLLFFVLVGYSTWLPGPIICSDWLKFQRSSSLKLMNWLNPNCNWQTTDNRRRTPSDGKSSPCLWQGELKSTKNDLQNIHIKLKIE